MTQGNTKSQDGDAGSSLSSSDLLAALGFIRGTGFDGEVWTNVDSLWMTQVWVCISGNCEGGDYWFDARTGINLKDFFSWWENRSKEEYFEREAERQMGEDW